MKRFIGLTLMFLLLSVNAAAVEYSGQRYRDPFGLVNQQAPTKPQAVKKEPLVLQGVVWNAKKPQAVINGQVVQAGSLVNDIKILEIKKEGVRAKYIDQDQEFVIKINQERMP